MILSAKHLDCKHINRVSLEFSSIFLRGKKTSIPRKKRPDGPKRVDAVDAPKPPPGTVSACPTRVRNGSTPESPGNGPIRRRAQEIDPMAKRGVEGV